MTADPDTWNPGVPQNHDTFEVALDRLSNRLGWIKPNMGKRETQRVKESLMIDITMLHQAHERELPEEPDSITKILNRLNTYTGDNVWQGVIFKLDQFNGVPHGMSEVYTDDVFVLRDGIVIRYSEQDDEWFA